MQGKQLIIPHHPQQHRLRTGALIGLAVLGVAFVGAVQGMMTLSKDNLVDTHDDFAGVAASVETMQNEAAEKTRPQGENLTGLADELRRVLSEKQDEQASAGEEAPAAAGEAPAEGAGEDPAAPDTSVVPSEGSVAGAQTEAPEQTPVVTP